jgi:hypothetical protein
MMGLSEHLICSEKWFWFVATFLAMACGVV